MFVSDNMLPFDSLLRGHIYTHCVHETPKLAPHVGRTVFINACKSGFAPRSEDWFGLFLLVISIEAQEPGLSSIPSPVLNISGHLVLAEVLSRSLDVFIDAGPLARGAR